MGCGVGMWMSEWRGWFPIHVLSIRSPSLRAQSRGREGELNPKHETSKGRYFILTLALNSEKREKNQVNEVGDDSPLRNP